MGSKIGIPEQCIEPSEVKCLAHHKLSNPVSLPYIQEESKRFLMKSLYHQYDQTLAQQPLHWKS